MTYPGLTERQRCSTTISADVEGLAASRAAGPLGFEQEVELKWIASRCDVCRACPAVLATLRLMMPPVPRPASNPPIQLRRTA